MTSQDMVSAKARRTYENLVQATSAEIAASGSFSAERVAKRAGTSPATFYSYFASKDAALAAAFSSVLDRLVAWIDQTLSIESLLEKSTREFCREFVVQATDFFTRESLVFRCALARLPEYRALRDAYREHESQAFQRYERFIALAQNAGKVRPGDPKQMARALLVLTQGLNNPLALGLGADDPLLRELADALFALLAPSGSGGERISE
ncbi:MAG: TetR/AcrR family transcriptional regulator [bacterium]|nr:TetR/AcrR family transcriptional regulator [bacterium]